MTRNNLFSKIYQKTKKKIDYFFHDKLAFSQLYLYIEAGIYRYIQKFVYSVQSIFFCKTIRET